MKTPLVKVCGMKQPDNMQEVLQAKPDWMGFIFYKKSPRYISMSDYHAISKITGVKKVGVFVNETVESVLSIAEKCGLNMLQLHGEESVEQCQELRKHYPILKAISVADVTDIADTAKYEKAVDYFLFDTKKAGQKGGTGEKFNWDILESYKGKKPFLLSGGISLEDVSALQSFQHDLCVGYDVNSGFEIEPGLKNANLVAKFITQIKDV